jgi:hypothetical protein
MNTKSAVFIEYPLLFGFLPLTGRKDESSEVGRRVKINPPICAPIFRKGFVAVNGVEVFPGKVDDLNMILDQYAWRGTLDSNGIVRQTSS